MPDIYDVLRRQDEETQRRDAALQREQRKWLPPPDKKCSKCGDVNHPDRTVCWHCGEPV